MYSTVQYCKLTLTLWVGERRVAAGGRRRAGDGHYLGTFSLIYIHKDSTNTLLYSTVS